MELIRYKSADTTSGYRPAKKNVDKTGMLTKNRDHREGELHGRGMTRVKPSTNVARGLCLACHLFCLSILTGLV